MIRFTGDLRRDFEKATTQITELNDRILGYQEQIAGFRATVKNLRQSKEAACKQYKETLAEKDAVIRELRNQPAHANALLRCLTGRRWHSDPYRNL